MTFNLSEIDFNPNKFNTVKVYLLFQGWSDEKTLGELDKETTKHKLSNERNSHDVKKASPMPPSKIMKIDPVIYPHKMFIPVGRNRKLSPLSNNKKEGVELVNLLAKERQIPKKIPLCSSDVTSEKKRG